MTAKNPGELCQSAEKNSMVQVLAKDCHLTAAEAKILVVKKNEYLLWKMWMKTPFYLFGSAYSRMLINSVDSVLRGCVDSCWNSLTPEFRESAGMPKHFLWQFLGSSWPVGKWRNIRNHKSLPSKKQHLFMWHNMARHTTPTSFVGLGWISWYHKQKTIISILKCCFQVTSLATGNSTHIKKRKNPQDNLQQLSNLAT